MDPKKPKITPHNLDLFTQPVADIYQALENEIFQMVAKRLKTSKTADKDYVLQWQVEKMQELRMFNQETVKALSKTTGLAEKEIRKAIEDVGYKTIASVDTELKYAFEPLKMPNQIDAILGSYVQQTFREIDNFVNQTLITTNYGEGTITRMYRKIVEETTGRVLAGTTTINKAVAETVIKWANKGIETAFVDRAGHVWSLERYADTVIRSTVNRTYNELRLSRMDEYGVDLVLVNSYPDARESCSKIQGRVASMKRTAENDSKYPSIYEFGYGEPDGIRGINCRHILYPYVEGLNENNQAQYDSDKAYERGKLVQEQRHYERQIRKAKRSLMLAEEIGDEDTIQKYKKLVRGRQAKIREFIEGHNLPRRYDKERVIVRGGNHS
ncbi:phage minor capsid protein [Bacillus sp. B15-48]|uniref:phage minor capsid protein n=1 Tax=Bacillus sp. B15-48 TaxID=1548601 RepID=UPI00193FE219|nr:phage minor capsid protein [Bacillus sp. B15-48]MBM4762715.1 capsid protein [Bacillus sp. B15-48]